jgi:SAM-dependent MidA family methyltransferase
MTTLEQLIKELITQEGPISLERFMALALGDPRHGYYMTRDPFGAAGDFTTAPEISQIFGELLGLWCADLWLRAGSPASLSLVELGPGRGTLMSDVLRATKGIPGLHDALSVTLVEMSPILRELQQNTLQKAHPKISWSQDISALPTMPTIVLANEFFDALPIRQFQRSETGWHERLVGLDEKAELAFGLSTESLLPASYTAENGDILEYGAIGASLMTELARHIAEHGGAGLLIDYGYTKTKIGDSLQAMKGHAFVNPLHHPGEVDLTTHVDFQRLGEAAARSGVLVKGPLQQADLLDRLGIATRSDMLLKKANDQQRHEIESATARLTDRSEKGMGSLFKALALHHPSWPSPAGF